MRVAFVIALFTGLLCLPASGNTPTPVGTVPELDASEVAFLKAHPVWRLAGYSTPPFQWVDAKGNFHGIAADYRALLEARLGVKFALQRADSWPASLERLKRRECDVSLLTAQTPDRQEFLAFTEPLLELPLAIITRASDRPLHGLKDLTGHRVAVARDFPIEEKLRRDYPRIVLVPRDDVGSGLSSVALGDADAYVGDLASATSAIDQLGLRNLKVAGETLYSFPFRIAVRKDWPEAVAILNKAIARITPEEHLAIRRKWINMETDTLPLRQVLWVAVPAVVGVALLMLLLVNRRLQRLVSRQKETEATLRASEQQWSFALEGARDGVWDWDVVTGKVYFSKRWKTMLGYGDAELPNELQEWVKRIHPDDFDRVFEKVRCHLRGECPEYEVEHRVETATGEYRWILARGRVMARDASGKAERMVGTHTDIEERKQSEQALEHAKQFAEDLVETANAIVIGLDPAGKVTIFNRTAQLITGYSKQEIVGRNVWEVLVPASRFPGVAARIEGGLPKQFENPILTKSGEQRYIVWQNNPLDEGGRAVGWISFGIDITERRRVEQELRRHEEQLEETIRVRTQALQLAERRLREVTDNLPGAVYQFVMKVDGSFAFAFCSEGFERMTGTSDEAAIRDANAVWARIHPEDVQELDRRARHSAATLTRYGQDMRVTHPDGRRAWIRAESEPRRQPDGSTLWNGSIVDITESKRLEEDLAVAKTASEAASRAKSVFLANMSHEIRTPMNAILGFSRLLLRDRALTGVQRENLETVHRSGEHLLALINDILEISKIEAGKIELRPAAFDLPAMLDDVERLFRLRAAEKGLKFSIECAGAAPRHVLGDEGRLRQVFVNLLGNATKFTERGGITTRVSVGEWLRGSVKLRVEVSDTGPGIAADEMPMLFQQFEQTTSGLRSGGGSGLGLAISREFVRLMGGDMQVDSRPGEGSTFSFTVVLGLADAALPLPADHRAVLGIRGANGPVRILVADDKPENCEVMEQLLRAVGFETRRATDGEAAIAAFAAWEPRVILMDLRMPGLDGLEAMRRIRRMPNGAAVAIIAVTASVFEEDRQRVIDAGGNDFLGKPFRESALFAKIRQLTGIDFTYEEEAASGLSPALAPDTASLAAELDRLLPGDLRAALHNAALAADFDELLVLAARVEAVSPALAAQLRWRVEHFDYTGLIEQLPPASV